MSKILLTVDTETKTVVLKVDGQEVIDLNNFSLHFYKPYCDKCATFDCECNLSEVLCIDFSVYKEVEGKNTETLIQYTLRNDESTDEDMTEGSYSGFKINPQESKEEKSIVIQDTIAKLFKS